MTPIDTPSRMVREPDPLWLMAVKAVGEVSALVVFIMAVIFWADYFGRMQ